MAFPNGRLSRRQKACLVLSVFILILGIVQLCLGILFSVKFRNRKCHRQKDVLLGVYLMVGGLCGIISNSCRGCSQKVSKKGRGFRASAALCVVFCLLVTLVILFDNGTLNCLAHRDSQLQEASQLYVILSFVEITVVHLSHLLCTLCAGLSCPDLLTSYNAGWINKPDRLLNSGSKHKTSKQALHLPEARTHVQESPGTGDKVTVVSLPETVGIVYAVPEEQYVIRRGDATYLAPAGNTHLTAFFPTYNRVEVD